MHDLGIRFLCGGDEGGGGLYFDTTVLGLELMRQIGLSCYDVLLTATDHAAEFLNMEQEIGSLQVGKKAKVVAVEGDPLQDLSTLRRKKHVVLGGRVVF